jgi:hypothetical protein
MVVTFCGECPYTFRCYTKRMDDHQAVYVCPVCSLTRVVESCNIESDDDAEQPFVRCDRYAVTKRQRSLFKVNVCRVHRELVGARDQYPGVGLIAVWETRVAFKGRRKSSRYDTVLYLCDKCAPGYAPWERSYDAIRVE